MATDVSESDDPPGGNSPQSSSQIAESLATAMSDSETEENQNVVYRFVGSPDKEFVLASQNPVRELFYRAEQFFGQNGIDSLYCSPVPGEPLIMLGKHYVAQMDNFAGWIKDVATRRDFVLRVDCKPFDG